MPAKVVSDISLGCGWYFLQTIWRNDSPSYSSIVNIITIEKKLLFLQSILNLYFSSSITSSNMFIMCCRKIEVIPKNYLLILSLLPRNQVKQNIINVAYLFKT